MATSTPAKPLKTPCTPPPTEASCAPLYGFQPRCRRRIIQPHGGPSMTRQEFKADCDINRILAKFQRTGALNHFAKFAPSYGDFTACDFQQAQNLLIRARQMFDELPSSVRREVSTPEGFLEFVQNPKNADRMAELGLTKRPPGARGSPAEPVKEPAQGS